MSSPPPHDGSRDVLSGHIEGLFALAQTVSSGAEEAIELVTETFRRASREGVSVSAADAVERARIELYRILLEVRGDRVQPPVDEESGARRTEEDMTDLKGRLAQRIVDADITAAFTSLAAEQRVLLMLCDIQRMNCIEAGRVLDLDADAACARLDDARAEIDRILFADATVVERRLLDAGLEGDWRREALRRMANRELSVVPPTLQPKLLAAASGTPARRAAERSEVQENRSARMKKALRRAAAIVAVILAAGVVGYGFSWMTDRPSDPNLIALSAAQAGSVEVGFQTTSAGQAQRYVRERLNRTITVPTIRGAALQGIAIRDLADGAEVPVIVYGNGDGPSPIVLYVYSYAFLDAHEDRLRLSRDVLDQIESEGNYDLHDLGESKALIWRRRADIYVAITEGDADELRDRISYSS